jgi:pimeloyl-ACP methyl ester carboxylesterase
MINTRLPASVALVAICAFLLTGCAQPYSKVTKRSAAAVTATPEQKSMYKSMKGYAKQPLTKLGGYLDWANASRLKLAVNPSDAIALSDYNFSVGRIIELIEEEGLTPWVEPVVCESGDGEAWSLSLTPLGPRPEYSPSNFEMLPADRYEFKGKLVGERVLKGGLGAPIVVTGKDMDFTKVDEFGQGKHIHYALTAAIRFDGRKCELVLKDPLNEEALRLDGHTYPLAADFQAPLSLALAEIDWEKKEIAALFKPDQYQGTARLARLQPYDPSKIPVLFIHGLSNSQATWAPMIDSLRNDATIRGNYQFWVFGYPSGEPYPLAAAELRRQLDKIRERYPNHKDFVVVGHSMGGMISRSLITASGTTLWSLAFDKPPGELGVGEDTQSFLNELLIFKARPDVSRVIYASASHRGSAMSSGVLGRLGANIVGDPVVENEMLDEAIAAARPESAASKYDRLPNSVDVLDPDSPFLKAVDTLAPKAGIPYHSIIGDRGKGGNLDRTKPESTDGIVPYWSSHLDGAESELIIPSEHWTILHPQGSAEVNRILKLHLRQR